MLGPSIWSLLSYSPSLLYTHIGITQLYYIIIEYALLLRFVLIAGTHTPLERRKFFGPASLTLKLCRVSDVYKPYLKSRMRRNQRTNELTVISKCWPSRDSNPGPPGPSEKRITLHVSPRYPICLLG